MIWPVVALLAVSYIIGVRGYFKKYQDTMEQHELTEKKIAVYLNSRYGAGVKYLKYLDIDDRESALLRLKSTYVKFPEVRMVSAKFNAFWYTGLVDAYGKGALRDIRYYESTVKGGMHRFPSILVTVPAGSKAGADLQESNDAIMELMKYEGAHSTQESIGYAGRELGTGSKNPVKNTLFVMFKADLMMFKGDYGAAAAEYTRQRPYAFIPPDFYYKAALCCERSGDRAAAEKWMKVFSSTKRQQELREEKP